MERQSEHIAPWLITPPPADGYFEAVLLDSIPLQKGVGIQLYNRKVALFRVSAEVVIACEDVCPHAGATLSNGQVRGMELLCTWHGWTFDLESGACHVNEHTPLRMFPVQIREGVVYVGVLLNNDVEQWDRD